MKYFVYNYFDVNLKVFDAPIITTEAPDVFVEKVKRTLKTVKPFDYQFAKDKKLFYFGVFDDVKGGFELVDKTCILTTNDDLPPFDVVRKQYVNSNFRDEKSDAVIYRLEFNEERERLRLKELEKEEGVKDGIN